MQCLILDLGLRRERSVKRFWILDLPIAPMPRVLIITPKPVD